MKINSKYEVQKRVPIGSVEYMYIHLFYCTMYSKLLVISQYAVSYFRS